MKKIFLTIAIVCFAIAANAQKIAFSEYDLPNGLHVILHQDNSTPNVVVSLMYHVGSKNEKPGKTGFAHLFEHLMFEGSDNIARGDYMKIVQSNGGELNANTAFDRTYYFELMPSNQLELALWMESERLMHAKIDSIGIATQKKVVLEERKQTSENQPYGSFLENLLNRAFKQHPYHWPIIGYAEDIKASTDQDVINFYKTYYVPNNAVLVIAGDFESATAKAMIAKYFADIPRGTMPMNRPNIVEPALGGEVCDTIYDNIQLPAVFMGYRAPAYGSKDWYTLSVLNSILFGGNSSRFKDNIDNKKLAMQSAVMSFPMEDPGLTFVIGIANMGGTAKITEEAITKQIDSIVNNYVSDEELQRAKATLETSIVSDKSSIANVAESLATYYTYFRNPNMINNELANYSNITRDDLKRTAEKYMTRDNRVVLYYLPKSMEKK